MKTIALALAATLACTTTGFAEPKKKAAKSAPTETSQPTGVSSTVREQAKSQSGTVGGRNGCTSWHIQSGAPCTN